MNIAAIIADDFSSATDCGVQFALNGVKTIALMDVPTVNSVDAEVIAIDTDSRSLPLIKAYENVFKAACYVGERGYNNIYKSIDSTLRGNLGSEIDAMMDALKLDLALICPAFPYYGRTTVNGCHFLNKVPIADSFMADDPTWPIRKSDISKLLADQTNRSIGFITLNELRIGIDHSISLLKQLKKDGKQLIIFDAEKEEDLMQIAVITSKYSERHLTVGSTGLCRYLPHAWKAREEGKKTLGIPSGETILLVAGSASPVTRRQVEKLIKDSKTFPLKLDTRSILDGSWKSNENRYLDKIKHAMDTGMDIVVYFDSYDAASDRRFGPAKKTGNIAIATKLSETLGTFTARILNMGKVFALILTGGDIAKAVCKELNIRKIELMQEVEAGIPLGYTTEHHKLFIVTKAGAFGTENSLINIQNILRGMKK